MSMTLIVPGLALVAVLTGGCGNNSLGAGSGQDLSTPTIQDLSAAHDLASPSDLAGCRTEKLKFTDCANDGSVEFCVPNAFAGTVKAAVPTVTCAAGGGRAMCNTTTQQLCFYPTQVPRECQTSHGALTPLAFEELCKLASYSEIVEIVPTFAP